MNIKCPHCGSTDVDVYTKDNPDIEFLYCYVCQYDAPCNSKKKVKDTPKKLST